ncbi:MAG: ABC transporter permease [Candidatus Bipolaricaulota bacterium]|nr:ABC transporter permease [Candidatus Bipolaricaulota bacterium]
MSFLGLILKNLWRHRIRSLLAITGISLGIATIIALGAIADGMEQNLIATLRSGKADFSIGQAHAPMIVLSSVPEARLYEIARWPEVGQAVGALVAFASFPGNPYFLTMGIEPEAFELGGVTLLAGRPFSKNAEDEVLLGKIAANTLALKPGDSVEIDLKKFRVVGIYETGNLLEDGGALLPLRALQGLKNRPSELTVILVRVNEGFSVEAVMARVEREYEGSLIPLRSAEEFNRNYQSLRLVRAGSWLVSLLALVIGGIGVMNTMIMSVFERTREIGILRAVGWRRVRVLALIMGESLALGALAAFVGTFLGWSGARAVTLLPQVRGLISPVYAPDLFAQALIIALGVGLVGGLYPAYRASHISPQEALRYE